jgi:glycosyltransferase involved in cell wall biosynthesis
MKILFFCWEYPPQGAGIGRYIAEISNALMAAEHEIIIVSSVEDGSPERETLPNGVLYRWFKRSDLRDAALAQRVAALAREEHVDWIEGADHWGVLKMHYNDIITRLRYAQAHLGWQRRVIDVACVHKWRSIREERFSLQHADMITACSQRILNEVRGQGVALADRVAVLPNPISPLAGWGNEAAASPTLLFVGRLDFGKGIAHFRPMIESLKETFPERVLEIAGDDSYARGIGSLRSWLERDMGALMSHVRLMGPLNPDALNAAYRRAWVVVAPSRWDTFPQVLLESMIRAKAVVTSPNGGMPEMVAGTECPVHDPNRPEFAHAIGALLQNAEQRKALGASLQKRAHEAYAPERLATDYVNTIGASL